MNGGSTAKTTVAKDAMASRASQVRSSEVAYDANNPFPPARPGECFAKIVTQPQYETIKEKVLVKEAATKIKTLPGKYDTVKERVIAKEASSRLEVIPATYKWVEEEVLVQPAKTTLRTVPARYKTLTERVIDKPATTKWKKGSGPLGAKTSTNSAGEVMCLVDVPATYKTITKKVVDTPARTEKSTIPAKYKTIRTKVVDQPASTRTVEIPAEYQTVTITKLVTPPTEEVVDIPAEYGFVTKTKQISEGNMVWRSILCDTNTSTSKVRQIQQALKSRGYSVSVDGEVGATTMRAINQFQKKNSLPVDNYLNAETVTALGVSMS